ncbi:MAG: hypothetical protein IJC18_04940 [Clostridia bacterium]|nr:hypothetical protein [Clostridia bacterium]
MRNVTRFLFHREMLDAKMMDIIKNGRHINPNKRPSQKNAQKSGSKAGGKAYDNKNGGAKKENSAKENPAKDGKDSSGKPSQNKPSQPKTQNQNQGAKQPKKPADGENVVDLMSAKKPQ